MNNDAAFWFETYFNAKFDGLFIMKRMIWTDATVVHYFLMSLITGNHLSNSNLCLRFKCDDGANADSKDNCNQATPMLMTLTGVKCRE